MKHDSTGVLSIDCVEGQYTSAVYRRPVEGDVQQLTAELEELLVTETPGRAARLGLGEPAYDLALVWNEAGFALPPIVAVGVESERVSLAPDGLESAPAEKACFATGLLDFDATGGRIVDLSLTLASILPWEAQIELLVRAASRLARVDWPSYLPVTDDFNVYACDMWGNVSP